MRQFEVVVTPWRGKFLMVVQIKDASGHLVFHRSFSVASEQEGLTLIRNQLMQMLGPVSCFFEPFDFKRIEHQVADSESL